jgi:hypothetical protein
LPGPRGSDDADGAVEYPGHAFVIVVADLGNPVADPEDPSTDPALRQAFPGGDKLLLFAAGSR